MNLNMVSLHLKLKEFKYFTKEDEFKYGVVAFEIERI